MITRYLFQIKDLFPTDESESTCFNSLSIQPRFKILFRHFSSLNGNLNCLCGWNIGPFLEWSIIACLIIYQVTNLLFLVLIKDQQAATWADSLGPAVDTGFSACSKLQEFKRLTRHMCCMQENLKLNFFFKFC